MYNILIIFNSNHIDLLMKKTILFLFSVFFYFQISIYVYFTFLFFFSIFFRAFQTQLNSQVNCDTCLSNLTILLLTSGMSTNFKNKFWDFSLSANLFESFGIKNRKHITENSTSWCSVFSSTRVSLNKYDRNNKIFTLKIMF